MYYRKRKPFAEQHWVQLNVISACVRASVYACVLACVWERGYMQWMFHFKQFVIMIEWYLKHNQCELQNILDVRRCLISYV